MRPSSIGKKLLTSLKEASIKLPSMSARPISTSKATFLDSAIYSQSYMLEFEKLLDIASKQKEKGLSISLVNTALDFLALSKSTTDVAMIREAIYNPANSKKLIQSIVNKVAKPTLFFLSADPMEIDGEEFGHAFCLYVDDKRCFLCDNNGSKYDNKKDKPNSYGNAKEGILEGIRELGFEVDTNSKPTFDERSICSFATLETIALTSKIVDPFEFLSTIDSLSKEKRGKLFPTDSIEELNLLKKTISFDEPTREIEDGGRS